MTRKFKVGQELWLVAADGSKFVTENIKITDVDEEKKVIANNTELYRFEDIGVLFFEKEKDARKAVDEISEKLQKKVVFQMNSIGQFERQTVVGVESAVHSNSVYDVALLLSGTYKKVSIKEIGKTIFHWDFHVGQKMFVLDYCYCGHSENQKLAVCSAEIIYVSEKRQIIKVIIENGKKRTYSFKDCNQLFFTNRDEAERATSKFPLYQDSQLYKKVDNSFFAVPLYRIKWRKGKVAELWFYLVDGSAFPSSVIGEKIFTQIPE